MTFFSKKYPAPFFFFFFFFGCVRSRVRAHVHSIYQNNHIVKAWLFLGGRGERFCESEGEEGIRKRIGGEGERDRIGGPDWLPEAEGAVLWTSLKLMWRGIGFIMDGCEFAEHGSLR